MFQLEEYKYFLLISINILTKYKMVYIILYFKLL